MTTTSRSSTQRRSAAALARRRQREQEILTATRALFDERGVRDAQIEDIASAVGVNRAIIYRHFSGKEELFALTLVGYLDDLADRLGDVSPRLGPRNKLREIIAEFVDFGVEFPAFVDCAMTLMRRPGPELFEEISEGAMFRLGRAIAINLGLLTSVLEAGNESGEFKIDNVNLLANTLYASGLGALQLARVGMLIREAAPGVPAIEKVSAEQIKDYLIKNALAQTAV